MAKALTNLFAGRQEEKQTTDGWGVISIQGHDLSSMEKFRQIIQRDQIRAAARAVLSRSIQGTRIVAYLNKQAAFAGHVSFSQPEGESPLGPISLVVECEDSEAVVDWLTGGYAGRRRS